MKMSRRVYYVVMWILKKIYRFGALIYSKMR